MSEMISQAQMAVNTGYEKANEPAAENVQAEAAATSACKKASIVAAERAQLCGAVECSACAHCTYTTRLTCCLSFAYSHHSDSETELTNV